jgi:hypothetical protein
MLSHFRIILSQLRELHKETKNLPDEIRNQILEFYEPPVDTYGSNPILNESLQETYKLLTSCLEGERHNYLERQYNVAKFFGWIAQLGKEDDIEKCLKEKPRNENLEINNTLGLKGEIDINQYNELVENFLKAFNENNLDLDIAGEVEPSGEDAKKMEVDGPVEEMDDEILQKVSRDSLRDSEERNTSGGSNISDDQKEEAEIVLAMKESLKERKRTIDEVTTEEADPQEEDESQINKARKGARGKRLPSEGMNPKESKSLSSEKTTKKSI